MTGTGQGASSESGEGLDAKLAVFDRYAYDALRSVIGWLEDRPEEIIAVARGRHVQGHYTYGDRHLTEYDPDRLRAEALEELADAVVYLSRRLHKLRAK